MIVYESHGESEIALSQLTPSWLPLPKFVNFKFTKFWPIYYLITTVHASYRYEKMPSPLMGAAVIEIRNKTILRYLEHASINCKNNTTPIQVLNTVIQHSWWGWVPSDINYLINTGRLTGLNPKSRKTYNLYLPPNQPVMK